MINGKKIIYVSNKTESSIKDIEQHNIDNLSLVSNGSIDTILCDCLDSIGLIDRQSKLLEMFNKLKVGGSVVIKTMDLKIFAKYILQDKLSKEQLNNMLLHTQSMFDSRDMDQILADRPNAVISEHVCDGIMKTIKLQRIK